MMLVILNVETNTSKVSLKVQVQRTIKPTKDISYIPGRSKDRIAVLKVLWII